MRIELGPSESTRSPQESSGEVDVAWSRFRPLARIEGRSAEERAAVHRVNVGRRELDLDDFERFLRQHVDEARRARTLDELIAHGRPKLPDFPWEQGGTTRENQDLAAVNGGFRGAMREALWELEKIRARLETRRPPLDVCLEASVGLKAKIGGREMGVAASLADRTVSASYGAAGVAARCVLDPVGEARCAGTAAGATVSTRGLESVEVSAGVAYGRTSRETVAAGVKLGRNMGAAGFSVRVEAKLGVNVQLLDAETVRRALSPEDQWTRKR